MIKGKRILITGGAGSIGSELVRQLHKDNDVFVIDNNESGLFEVMREYGVKGEVRDVRALETLGHGFIDYFCPQIVFHAAALKHVSLMEESPREAVKTNILGTLNILSEAKRSGVESLVFISTDKAVQCSSVMGTTKRVAELCVKNAGYTTVRFGNVLGSRGSVIPIWQKAIDQGDTVKVTDERMTRYMMTIEEAVGLVIEAAKDEYKGKTVILDMGKPINVLELAKKIVKGTKSEIEMIGVRAGEELHETLMYPYEKEKAIKKGKFFVIS